MTDDSPSQSRPSADTAMVDSLGDVLVVGCGYLGRRIAALASGRAANVWGTTRNPGRTESLRRQGIRPVIFDWSDRRTLSNLPAVDHVVVAVAYDRSGSHCRWQSQVGGFTNLLRAVDPRSDVTYISTTGVYHQCDGGWVDERTPTRPIRLGGRVHLHAESLLHRFRPQAVNCAMRLAGIYGPGRIPRIGDVRAGKPITANLDGWLNLIHVDDAARAVVNFWQRLRSDQHVENLYCVADDLPMHRADFYRHAATLTRSPPPRFIAGTSGGTAVPRRSRSDSNKRVCNRRTRRDLLPALKYPTYREGLRSILCS